MSFAVEPERAAYVPLAHDYAGAPAQLDRHAVLAALRPLLEDASKDKVGQHLKYDMNVLSGYGIGVRGVRYDSMLESYVLNSSTNRHDMDALASLSRRRRSATKTSPARARRFRSPRSTCSARLTTPPRTPTSRCACIALWPKLDADPSSAAVRADRDAARAGARAWNKSGDRCDKLAQARISAGACSTCSSRLRRRRAPPAWTAEAAADAAVRWLSCRPFKTPTGQPSTNEAPRAGEYRIAAPDPRLRGGQAALDLYRQTRRHVNGPAGAHELPPGRRPDGRPSPNTRPQNIHPYQDGRRVRQRSSRRRVSGSSRRTTGRSNCASWRTYPAMPVCWPRSRQPGCAPRDRRRSGAAEPPMRTSARPRRSISA